MMIFLGALFYYAVKFLSPALIQSLHQAGHFSFLNFVCGGEGNQVVEFYIGEWELRIAGPVTSLLAGLLFLSAARRYLLEAPKVKFGAAVFIFLVLTKFETLLNPPYGGDAITAVFAEAIWLHRNHLDFVGLLHQPTYVMGGPRTYFVSIYPALLALQMTLFPSVQAFLFFNHLLTFFMGSVVVALFRDIARKVFDPRVALLGSVAFLSFPMFQSQVELINMEMPCLFFAFLSAYGLIKMRLGMAAVTAALAGFVKGTGVIAAAAVFIVCLVIFLFHPQKRGQRRVLAWGLGTLAVAFIQVWFTNQVHNQKTVIGFIKPLVATVIKDQISLAFLFCLTVSVFYLWCAIKKEKQSLRDLVPILLLEHYPVFVMGLFALMWFSLFMNFTVLLARYKLLVYPFLIFWGLFSLKAVVGAESVLRRVLISLICVWLIANHGLLELERGDFQYIQVERSLEYRNVLKRDVRLAREMEKNFSRFLIAAQPVVAHFLAQPELGYVRKDLEVMIYSMTCTYSGIRNFPGLNNIDMSQTVWVGYNDALSQDLAGKIDYPVDPQDVVLKEIVYGRRKATIFVGGYAVEKVRKVTHLLGEKRRRHFGMPEEGTAPSSQ